MRTHRSECIAVTGGAPDFVDITDDISAALVRSGIRDGQVTIFSGDGCCSLLVQERESGLLYDIEHALERLGATAAADRLTLVGSPSVVLPAVEGRLHLGVWQRVLLVEHHEPQSHSVTVQIMGE